MTTSSVFSSESGFSTKSCAPRRTAFTAVSIVPWPEITTTGSSASDSRMRASTLEPVHPRQPHVEQHEVVAARLERLERGLARCPPRPRRSPRRRGSRRARRARPPRRRRPGSSPSRLPLHAGSSTTKRAPRGALSSTRIVPWCSWTMRLTIARPSPLPALLGREVRDEQPVAVRGRDAGPVVGHHEPHAALRRGRTRSTTRIAPLALRRLDRVVHQVDDHPLHLVGVEPQRRQVGGEAALDRALPGTGRRRATAPARSRRGARRAEVGRGQARELRELVHQVLERLHLVHDRARALGEDPLEVRGPT